MKKTLPYWINLIVISLALQTSIIYADTNLNKTDAAPDAPALPLSAGQISKLQQLFPAANVSEQTVLFKSGAFMPEHIVWQQIPIDVVLPVNKERMLRFPASVQFGYDKSQLPDTVLRVQNNDGTLYLLAKNTFAPQRVEVKLNDTGKIILLNLSAEKEASNTPLAIVVPSETAAAEQPEDLQTGAKALLKQIPQSVSEVDLMRFAVQQLYAPKRLLAQPSGIFRTPMHTHKTLPLLPDGSVMALPLASWRSSNQFVTAVLLRNQTKQPLTLDARLICGDWQAAAFFPQTVLAPGGNPTDSTTVFLLSKRAFAETFASCTQGF